jgi:hypothetical protein
MIGPGLCPGLTALNALAQDHLHGISTAMQAMWIGRTARPESVAGVPYILQLLVHSRGGISALRECYLVTYGGVPCPDELGDGLVSEGVQFANNYC